MAPQIIASLLWLCKILQQSISYIITSICSISCAINFQNDTLILLGQGLWALITF